MLDATQARPAISDLCRSLKVKRLDVFGSAATDDFGPDSDIDVLVTLERDGTDLFNRYFDLKEGLEELFDREVDLVIEESIRNPYFRQSVESSRKNIYAA